MAKIAGEYNTQSPEHTAARTSLLAPIADQNTRIGDSMRRRRTVMDVDPGTGAEQEPLPGA